VPLSQPRRQRIGKLDSDLAEVAAEQFARQAAREFDAIVGFE
jgi:hypothetical protein